MNSTKSFDKQLCEQCDPKTKIAAIEVLEQLMGFQLTIPLDQQPEQFKRWDFLMTWEDKEIPIEVEQSLKWKHRGYFPWFEGHYLGRKESTEAKVFLQFNFHLDTCWFLPISAIKSFPQKRINTIYTKGELMRIIPKDNLWISQRDENGMWKIIQKGIKPTRQ